MYETIFQSYLMLFNEGSGIKIYVYGGYKSTDLQLFKLNNTLGKT